MGKKESKYGGEFHDAILAYYRGHIDGAKIHGSPFQPRGLPDYMYYADAKIFGTTFMGIEAKYISKLLKRKPVDMDKLLRPEQKKRLYKINKFGGIGLQLTIIERSRTDRVVILTRPRIGEINRISPAVIRGLKGSGCCDSLGTTFLYTVRNPSTKASITDRYDLDILKNSNFLRGGYAV